jgi:hypothetical protein
VSVSSVWTFTCAFVPVIVALTSLTNLGGMKQLHAKNPCW